VRNQAYALLWQVTANHYLPVNQIFTLTYSKKFSATKDMKPLPDPVFETHTEN